MFGDPDEAFEFTPDPGAGKPLSAFLACMVFAAIGVWMVSTAQDTMTGLAGIASIVFFGGGGIALAVVSLKKPRRITFTREGLWLDGAGGRKLVEWKNVEAIGITTHQGTMYNMLRLRDPSRFQIADQGNLLSQLGRLNRNWWGGEIAIGPVQRDRPAEDFGRLLELWRAKYG